MRCDDVRDLRIDWLRGRLPADRAREMEVHLAACDACRAEIDAERRLDRLLDQVPAIAVPEGFARRTIARALGRAWRLRAVRWGAALAACLAVAFLATEARGPAGLSAEDREIVEHLDLLEDLPVFETADLVEDPSEVDALDLAADLEEELY